MLSDTILKYKNHFSKFKRYRIEYNDLFDMQTNSKISLDFVNPPFKAKVFYNGFTDEYYVYAYACTLSLEYIYEPINICDEDYEDYDKCDDYLVIDTIEVDAYVLFYSIPDLKLIKISRNYYYWDDEEHNRLFGYNGVNLPIINTIANLNKEKDFQDITHIGNIPVYVSADANLYTIYKKQINKLRKLKFVGVYNNLFVVYDLDKRNKDKKIFTDLKSNIYLQAVDLKRNILFNVVL